MAFLQVLAPDGSGLAVQTLPVHGTEVIIGRGEGVDVRLDHPSVSRQHARLTRGPDGWTLSALSLTQGIGVGGRFVAESRIEAGTTFSLGQVTLRFMPEDPRQARTIAMSATAPPASTTAPAAAPSASNARENAWALSEGSPEHPAARPRNEGRGRAVGCLLIALVLVAGLGGAGWLFRDRIASWTGGSGLPFTGGGSTAAAPSLPAVTRPVSSPCATAEVAARSHRTGDRAAIAERSGVLDAFVLALDPNGSEHSEQWIYRSRGEVVALSGGSYRGGVRRRARSGETPPVPLLPWQVLADPRGECVVQRAGPALWQTSAVVLPGWNDEAVAHVWRLARGGTLTTVGDRVVAVEIDPATAFDAPAEAPLSYVGELRGDGGAPLGALLSRGERTRLSISPRGQGTTEDGVEHVLVLQPSGDDPLAGEYVTGTGLEALRVSADGRESPMNATGRLVVQPVGAEYRIDAQLELGGSPVRATGQLRNALWAVGEGS